MKGRILGSFIAFVSVACSRSPEVPTTTGEFRFCGNESAAIVDAASLSGSNLGYKIVVTPLVGRAPYSQSVVAFTSENEESPPAFIVYVSRGKVIYQVFGGNLVEKADTANVIVVLKALQSKFEGDCN